MASLEFSKHALKRMEERRIKSKVVDNTINKGKFVSKTRGNYKLQRNQNVVVLNKKKNLLVKQ